MSTTTQSPEQKCSRGFARMPADQQRQAAQRGGRAAHASGTAHEFTSEEARAAGRKGGASTSQDKAHMAEIGRKGGSEKGRRLSVQRAAESQP